MHGILAEIFQIRPCGHVVMKSCRLYVGACMHAWYFGRNLSNTAMWSRGYVVVKQTRCGYVLVMHTVWLCSLADTVVT